MPDSTHSIRAYGAAEDELLEAVNSGRAAIGLVTERMGDGERRDSLRRILAALDTWTHTQDALSPPPPPGTALWQAVDRIAHPPHPQPRTETMPTYIITETCEWVVHAPTEEDARQRVEHAVTSTDPGVQALEVTNRTVEEVLEPPAPPTGEE